MDKYGIVITNQNEITKSEFDELDKVKEFDKFTSEQVTMAIDNIIGLIKKSETEELSSDEQDLIKSGIVEIQNLTKYTINEKVNGRIVKSDIYVQPKQVEWEDTLEKSEGGETIKKGIYLDTELNQKLGRVGDMILKGKTIKKNEEVEDDEEEEKDDMNEEEREEMEKSGLYQSCMDKVKKGEGGDKDELIKSLTEEHPEADSETIGKYVNHVYKSISRIYKEKANDYLSKAKDSTEG